MSVRAVFLDVDDTLVDYQHAATTAFHEALGPDADYGLFVGLDHYERFLQGDLDFQQARDERMTAFLRASGRPDDDAVELEARRYALLSNHYVLFDDALPCLAALRERGMRIGLITNNEAAHQRAKIASVGLDRLVDAIVISGELRIAKPDVRIFAHACAQLEVAPHEALHIGDNPYADALGALDAGLRAAWLDRSGVHARAPLAFPVITDLRTVTELMD